jgi:hypothetical protein
MSVPRLLALLAPAGAAAMAAAGFGLVYFLDPNEEGHYPTCPFLAVTGFQCPGCGALRMIHALGHGRVGEAFALNPLAFGLLPVLAYLWLRWTAAVVGYMAPRRPARPWLIWSLLAVVVVFWIGRSLAAVA